MAKFVPAGFTTRTLAKAYILLIVLICPNQPESRQLVLIGPLSVQYVLLNFYCISESLKLRLRLGFRLKVRREVVMVKVSPGQC